MTTTRQRLAVVGVALAIVLTLGSSVSAQTSAAPFEVFAGYSYLPADGNDFPRTNSHGFETAAAVNFTSWVSVVVDVGAHFSHRANLGPNFRAVTADSSVVELLAGPQFTRRGKVSPFAHALVGRARGKTTLPGFSDSAFALAVGGGVDAVINRRFAGRVQVEALGSFVDMLETNLRVAGGLVLRIGTR